jgi:trimeric autotransporter adhesin
MKRVAGTPARCCLVAAGLLLLWTPQGMGAQSTPKVFFACYVPGSGAVYRIREPGLRTQCWAQSHMQFSWIDGVPGHDHGALNGLLDDDHPQYVLAEGARTAATGFAVAGTFGAGAIPATGPGVRLLWHPAKAAFRAGQVEGDRWDDGNVGPGSVALGVNTLASGNASTALGSGTTATGDGSTALGSETVASGSGATALGTQTQGGGLRATAMGYRTVASGSYSTALGSETVASGFGSTAMGGRTTASGAAATAMGSETVASGATATAMGFQTIASGDRSTALGTYASTNGQPGALVYGDASTTTVVQATGPNQFVVRAAGGFLFRTAPDLSTGCDLPAGSGSWSCTSDRNRKENFSDEDAEGVLERISHMRIQSWNWKGQDPRVRHLGPTAQDFYAAFGLGEGETTISLVDMDGVNLLAIQALERRTREQAGVVGALRAENAALLAELEALMQEARSGLPKRAWR